MQAAIPSIARVPLQAPPQAPPPAAQLPSRPVPSLLGGVLLPVVAIAIEAATGICAKSFFDPIPTIWHTLLAGLAPVGNLLVWWRRRPSAALSAINACAIAVSVYFALRFLPIFPLALLALIFGIGLLPLAPLLSLWAAIRLRGRFLGGMPLRNGLLAGAALIAAVEAPAVVAFLAVEAFESPSVETRERAVKLMRCCGSERSLQKDQRPAARLLHFRATGRQVHGNALSPGLAMGASLFDGSVDPAAGLGYLEWTMVLRNAEPWQQEARASIDLPFGGVVSRATLWIGGEEREAAFGGRAQVREAYERVVTARRDPLLVLTDGPDRIQIRCFPVPAEGEMKIRVGITAPLHAGDLRLPRISAANFETSGLEHSLWIEAPGSSFRKQVRELPLTVSFPEASPDAWTPDPRDPLRFHITQRTEMRPNPRAERLIAVVDTSGAMKPFAERINNALQAAAADASVHVFPSPLRAAEFAGGVDNVPALLDAQKRAAARQGSAILWIHGPQEMSVTSAEPLRQFWRRRPGIAPLYSLRLAPGRNVVLETIADQPEVRRLDSSVEGAIRLLTTEGMQPHTVRERVSASPLRHGHRTSAHLARLWANEEIHRRLGTGGDRDRKDALDMARAFQLVTPVSGAVVLETKAQYDAAGLKPVHPTSVPTVPEPETWALLAVALGVVVVAVRRRRRACVA